jgi:hypothetical protein
LKYLIKKAKKPDCGKICHSGGQICGMVPGSGLLLWFKLLVSDNFQYMAWHLHLQKRLATGLMATVRP